MFIFESDSVRNQRIWRWAYSNIDCFCNLPGFENDTHALTEQNHPRSTIAVIHEVQENDELHEYVGQNCPNGDADVVFLIAEMRLNNLVDSRCDRM